MAKYFVFVLLATFSIVPRAVAASETYAVTLVSVWTNKTALGNGSENVRFTIDNVVQSNKDRAKDNEEKLWHINRSKTRRIDLACLEGKPLGTSFAVQLDAIDENSAKNIGKVAATLQQEDGEPRLAFTMQHGNRTLRLRRRGGSDGNTVWVTRVFPDDRSSNYVLRFRITKK